MESSSKNQEREKVIKIKTFTIPSSLGEIKENIIINTDTSSKHSKEEEIYQVSKLHSQENKLEAANYYNSLINQGSNDYRVFSNYGVILKDLGKLKEAEITLRKAIKLNPHNPKDYKNLGSILVNQGQLKEALIEVEKAIKINPNYEKAHLNLGVILRYNGQIKEAELSFRKALEIKPDYADAHYNLGIILKDSGRSKEAELSFQKAIKIKPNWEASFLYSSILFDKKDFDGSLSNLQRIKSSVTSGNLKTVQAAITAINLTKKKSLNKNQLDSSKTSKLLKEEKFNRLILKRPVEKELLSYLYKLNTILLDNTDPNDSRYGKGLCSDFNLFEDNSQIIRKLESDLIEISKRSLNKKKLIITDSFFNIFISGSGSRRHHHIGKQDMNFGLYFHKYSLVYYLDIGDQTSQNPGVLKLYNPDEEILPSNDMIIILNSTKLHSVSYVGKKDRVMVGINFYAF
ncbi:tetratricopeptide repeat protein [Prochlorococcus sp. MIT 0801]|uniref:tetratricopeptide repeat protein n=1 Tax=Prochlorococcus sp. MIT 0801 TaxID=1501269 RepID=UPI0004F6F870|nr:tetratricopeptide repeat protein [Prochlorococcus sp. MIT 0801]AIQ98133.1 Translation elongation factor P [Prochlorococcus sp. MIT 0801]